MNKKYEVNAGNIGNIECMDESEAMSTYLQFVKYSKHKVGRIGEEDVCLLVDGEPVQEFNYYEWRIGKQEDTVTKIEKLLLTAQQILTELQLRQEGC